MSKIGNITILKRCLIYSTLVWLVNILIILSFIFSITEGSLLIWVSTILALSAVLGISLFGVITYLIIKTRLNHWIKKILLALVAILMIAISSYMIFGEDDYEGEKIYKGFSLIFSIPTLITIGIFYPDQLDEELRKQDSQ